MRISRILTAYILVCTVSTFGCGKIRNYDDISEQDSEQSEGSVYAETDRTQDESDVTSEQDENGSAYIDNWWIEEDRNYYANPQGNRIIYADGYFYYASQLDNYFLYRVKEDGSNAECLTKVHSGTILIDGDVLYFVNLSDNKAIYRIGTDGSDMLKICDNYYNKIQMSAEYIYFCDTYEREADIRGLFSEEEAEEIESKDEYLRDRVFYRIRKDGSGKEILRKTAWNCMLDAACGDKVMYDGYLCHEARGFYQTVCFT